MIARPKFAGIAIIALLLVSLAACGPVKKTSAAPGKTATPTSTPEVQGVFLSDCGSRYVQRPKDMTLACGDGGIGISDISWSTWSSQRANGTGNYYAKSCDPSCLNGKFSNVPITVILGGVVPDTGNRFVYSKVNIAVSGRGVLNNDQQSDEYIINSASPESIISERAKVVRISTPEARSAATAVAKSAKAVADSYTAAATAWGREAYLATAAATDSEHTGNGLDEYKVAFYAARKKTDALNNGLAKGVANVSLTRETFFGTPEGATYKNSLDYHISYEALKMALGTATTKSTQAGISRAAYQSAYDDYVSNSTDPFNINAIAYAYFMAASNYDSAAKATAVAYANFYNLLAEFWAALAGSSSS